MSRKRKRSDEIDEPHRPAVVGCEDRIGLGPLPISMPGMIVANSKPRGGKSYLFKYLIYMNRRMFSHGIVFSKSAFRPGNMDYIPRFPEDKTGKYLNFKHMRYDENKLRKFLEHQQSYSDEERPLGFIIVDDEISSNNMWNSEAMIDAATMYRHYNVVVFIATQYINKISTTIRECATQVALFKMDSKRAINAAWESYGSEFDNYNVFKNWLESNTTPADQHKFCWKDKMYDLPWRVAVAPPLIPKFRLRYGLKAAMKKAIDGRKKKKRRKRGIPLGPFARNAMDTFKIAQAHSRGGNAVEDSVTRFVKPVYE